MITAQDSRAGALRELARLAAHLELHDLEILRLLAGRLAADRGRCGAPRASAAGAELGGEAEPSPADGVRLGAPRCASCGSALINRRSNASYCSGRCRAAASRERRRPPAAGRDDVGPRDGSEEYDILPPAEVLHAPADGGNGCTVAGDFEGMNIPSSPVPAEPAEFEEGVL